MTHFDKIRRLRGASRSLLRGFSRRHAFQAANLHQYRPGPAVDATALIKALQDGWIAGAGLDVLATEPPGQNNPLLKWIMLVCHHSDGSFRPGAQAARAGVRIGTQRRLADGLYPSQRFARLYSSQLAAG